MCERSILKLSGLAAVIFVTSVEVDRRTDRVIVISAMTTIKRTSGSNHPAELNDGLGRNPRVAQVGFYP